MAIGDQADITARIISLLPNGWFQGETPILDAVVGGIASALASVYSLIAYARLQTRIATATDGFLDLISFDFFGNSLSRKPGETDTAFRTRIQSELLLERATRAGLIKALTLLTGRAPKIFEPALPLDTGGYDTNSMGYDEAGGYGALNLNSQAFIIAYRPAGSGIPYIAGYDSPEGAYDTASQAEYTDLSQITGLVTDADIYQAIASVIPEDSIAWTQLSN